jgi:hypothetical protein
MVKLKMSIAVAGLVGVLTSSNVNAGGVISDFLKNIPSLDLGMHEDWCCDDSRHPPSSDTGAYGFIGCITPALLPMAPQRREGPSMWDERPMWDYLRRSSPVAPPILPRIHGLFD